MRPLRPVAEYAYVLLRIVAGLLFAVHGAQKLFGVVGGRQVSLTSLLGLAGIIEFFGGVMIALGIYAPIVAFIASGEMAVAYIRQHAPRGYWPILNGGELAALYCIIFLYVAGRGAGRFAITKD